RKGLSEFAKKQYKGNRRNMSAAEEEAFLATYKKEAGEGHIIETSAIKAAYEEKVGRTIGGSQIYRVLHRHDWRKIMPRSRHPKKASGEAIEASKKIKKDARCWDENSQFACLMDGLAKFVRGEKEKCL
ncbi:MAG: winged helix-turn-helix domain-containing protein, partial [Firmicutes bacterium]|nr:winged helix-turn-helix domain-containing protein [Bacillota bacterium]